MAIIYRCRGYLKGACDYESAEKWTRRCPGCGGYHSIVTKARDTDEKSKISLAHLTEHVSKKYIETGLAAFDKVVGGGIVPGAPYIMSGPPGTGKTTLMLTVASAFATEKRPVLYTSGEQSRNDIADLAKRIGALSPWVEVMGNNGDMYKITERAEEMKAKLVCVDSINTAAVDECDSTEGTSAQIKAVANYLSAWCKHEEIALVAITHINKDGELSGPRALEHLFDTILELDPAVEVDEEGEVYEETKGRIKLESGKNRHGASGVREYFKMTETGIVAIRRRSKLELV